MKYIDKNLLQIALFTMTITINGNTFDGAYLFKLQNATQAEMGASISQSAGMMLYNTTDKKVYYFDANQWVGIDKTRVVIKNNAYTLSLSDDGVVLTFDSASDVTLTVPTGLPVGYNVSVYQINTGKILISGSAGVSVKNRLSRFKTAGKDAGIGIISTANDVFHVTGDLKK